jgi:desumoylating isopeptidase 1
MRPTIDAMYRPPGPGTAPVASATNTTPDPQLASSILQAVASQAANGSAHTNGQSTNSLTSPMHVITNPATFNNFLKTHRAVVAFFTSATCPPCRMIEPVFERLSEEKGFHENRDGAGFAKIDIDVGMGRNLASEWGIRATPTFMFFLDGKKVRFFFPLINLMLMTASIKLDELKGANANELRTQIDLLLFQAYPRSFNYSTLNFIQIVSN